jgi:hypothetical protein
MGWTVWGSNPGEDDIFLMAYYIQQFTMGWTVWGSNPSEDDIF